MKLRDYEGLRLTLEDIRQKFGNTYLRVSHPSINAGRPTVIQLWNMEGGEARATFHSGKLDDVKQLGIMVDDLDVLEFYPKAIGVIPYNDNDIIFVRKGVARQWQVGLCQANTIVYSSLGTTMRWDLSAAEAIYDAVYKTHTYREVLKQFAAEKYLKAVALNSVYWMCRRDEKIVLNRNQIPLGSFVYDSFFVNKACTDLGQELWDDLRLRVKTHGT